MSVLLKHKDETEEQYLWRIGNYIDSHPDMTWNSISDSINIQLGFAKQNWKNASTFRKRYQTAKKFYDNAFIQMNNNDVEKYLQDIRKERIKIQTLNVERNKIDRQEARQELFYEQIGFYLKNSSDDLSPILTDIIVDESMYDEKEEYLLVISDIHAFASFSSHNNEYSPIIMADRFKILAEKTIKFIIDHHLKQLHVLNCGDSIQGIIHMNDLKINDSSVVKATVEVSRLLTRFINELSKYCLIHYYHVPTSNHTQIRFLGCKPNALMDQDLEYIIGNYIKDSISGNNKVIVHLDEDNNGYIYLPILGLNIVAIHGHLVRNLDTIINDVSNLIGITVDYLIMGHQHASKELTINENQYIDMEVLVAPSFVGSDPYSDSIFKGSKPAVKIYGFNELDGHDQTYKFILS